jgi:hypothetical protein
MRVVIAGSGIIGNSGAIVYARAGQPVVTPEMAGTIAASVRARAPLADLQKVRWRDKSIGALRRLKVERGRSKS